MFNIRVGDTQFDIYPLLDANEVVLKLHEVMKTLCNNSRYKTFISYIEKYSKQDEKSIGGHGTVHTYTLTILKSRSYLKQNEIALLFKEMFKKQKKKKNNRGLNGFGEFNYGY